MAESSSNLYQNLLEFAPDALIAVDKSGIIIYANAHAHTLFGYAPGTMHGIAVERLIPAQSRDKHAAYRSAYGADPKTREMGNRGMPLYGERLDGSRFRAEIRLAPIRTPDGVVTAAAVRDATESERVMSMLAAAKETSDEANATKSRFLAAASHDLRQPLQTLRLLNGTLKRLSHDAVVQDVLDQEDRALSTMSELLNALLNVSKLESGTVQPTISEFSVDSMFEDLRQQFATPAKFKNLQLDIEANNVVLRTDSTLLCEMVQNLLANAIRYTDEGGIMLRCRREDGHTLIEVEDTGVGINEAIQERIFDDFFQAAAHGATHRGGVGLGLGIVRRLSRMLDLPIQVRSRPNEGTRFSIDVTHVAAAGSPQNEKSAPQTNVAVSGGKRILLIEDEKAMRMALKTYLELDDHQVSLAASLSELEALLPSLDAPDIVISDFKLGERDRGTDAIESIRAKFGAQVPAIVLTGDTSQIPAKLSEQPATRMLNKPVDVQQLVATMQQLLK